MADLSFKISDLDTIPSRIDEINKTEKIALENTYFLGYSHTIHGMNYVTKNYKIPLSLLRNDIRGFVEELIGSGGITVNDFESIKNLNISSNEFNIVNEPVDNTLNISIQTPNDFIKGGGSVSATKENNKWIINSPTLSGSGAAIITAKNNNWNVHVPEPVETKLLSSDSSIQVQEVEDNEWDIKAAPTPYYDTILDAVPYSALEWPHNSIYLDQFKGRSLYIIGNKISGNTVELNFLGYLSDLSLASDAICSFKLYLNTLKRTSDLTFSGEYIRWAGTTDSENNTISFKPNRIYSITFTSLPLRVFEDTGIDDDLAPKENGRALVGIVDWFIPFD